MDRTLVERAIQGLVRACYVEADQRERPMPRTGRSS